MTDPSQESAWCEIALPQLARNLHHARDLLPGQTRLCVVVKGDAYGHGIENVAPVLMAQGVDHIGIASNPEARALRAAGFKGTVLRLRTATPQEVQQARGYDVEEMVGSLAGLEALISALGRDGLPRLHISLNADGMSRDGLELSCVAGRHACQQIVRQAETRIVGLCTHFPSNQPGDLAQSIARFQRDLSWTFDNTPLDRASVLVHAGSTLTLASGQDPQVDMMRCGAILYGIAGPGPQFGTTLTLKSRVISIGGYPKGSTIGYDRTTTLEQDRVLASVALGYANGYCRQLSGRGSVLIRGETAPVMGKVSMNTIVADVTGLNEVAIGDEVVVYGAQGPQEISTHMIEGLTGRIMADLFTDWGQRNPRLIHIEDVSCTSD